LNATCTSILIVLTCLQALDPYTYNFYSKTSSTMTTHYVQLLPWKQKERINKMDSPSTDEIHPNGWKYISQSSRTLSYSFHVQSQQMKAKVWIKFGALQLQYLNNTRKKPSPYWYKLMEFPTWYNTKKFELWCVNLVF
jgi:hypothetical protein